MGRNLGRRPDLHFVTAQDVQRPGLFVKVAAVENKEALGLFNVVQEVGPEGPSVPNGHVRMIRIGLVKGLDRTNAEAFVGPENVPDSENERRLHRCSSLRQARRRCLRMHAPVARFLIMRSFLFFDKWSDGLGPLPIGRRK